MKDNYQNIEFELYEYLYSLKSILSNYDIDSKFALDINEHMDLIKTKKYNVAVVGEFKRGKSSLINALLGMKILPSDVTPTTATINRITYGIDPEVEIIYKDGNKEKSDINVLADYITKTTREQEQKALTIKEAIVYYPIVICQNHVDIIDTPGLNDDEAMTRTTVGLLENIDAAIVVISALMPFSETESKLVINLIESKEISHIVFVVSFIDQINEEDQDKLINAIKNRIKGVIPYIESKHEQEPKVIEKAHRILDDMDLFAVSTSMALESFITNNTKLLRCSHFQEFKKDLYTILTAQQSINVVEKVTHIILFSNDKLEDWYKKKEDNLNGSIIQAKESSSKINYFFNSGLTYINNLLLKSHNEISKYLNTDDLKQQIKTAFIGQLSKVKENTDKDIRNAVHSAEKECSSIIDDFLNQIRSHINEDFTLRISEYSKVRNESYAMPACLYLKEILSEESFLSEKMDQLNNAEFPEFKWDAPVIPGVADLTGVNIIVYINSNTEKSLKNYNNNINSYIAAFRMIIFSSFLAEKEQYQQKLNSLILNRIKESEKNLMILHENFIVHKNELKQLVSKSNDLLSNIYQ